MDLGVIVIFLRTLEPEPTKCSLMLYPGPLLGGGGVGGVLPLCKGIQSANSKPRGSEGEYFRIRTENNSE